MDPTRERTCERANLKIESALSEESALSDLGVGSFIQDDSFRPLFQIEMSPSIRDNPVLPKTRCTK